MGNSKEHDEDTDEIGLSYFESWRKRDQKSKKIYVRLRPEEKDFILAACKETKMTASEFIRGASLEASEAVLKNYRTQFPNIKLQ
jgi:uncharacterized protein (DUF1778 family)